MRMTYCSEVMIDRPDYDRRCKIYIDFAATGLPDPPQLFFFFGFLIQPSSRIDVIPVLHARSQCSLPQAKHAIERAVDREAYQVRRAGEQLTSS